MFMIFVLFRYQNSSKKTAKGNKPGKGGNRFWKNIGLGFKTPRDAIEGSVLRFFTTLIVFVGLLK